MTDDAFVRRAVIQNPKSVIRNQNLMNPSEHPPELPESARRTFDGYPQIEPSPAFNRAVLESLEAAHAAHRLTWLGRIEEFVGLKWWQFAASGMLGALLPALILGALFLSNRGVAPQPTLPLDPTLPRSIGPLYARELWREREPIEAPPPGAPELKQGEEISCVALKFRSV